MDKIEGGANYFTVYKITNLVNGKIYIGMHKTNNLDDNYMGSGKVIRSAIRKYGLKNFNKEILFVFDNEQEMKNKEKELVTEEFLDRPDTYNLTLGGRGGFYYVNRTGLAESKEHLKLASKRRVFLIKNDESYRKEFCKKVKKGLREKNGIQKMLETKRRKGYDNKTFLGKHHSEESKRKISLSKKGKQTTSTLGKSWYTNGKENILCFPNEVPNGFSKGRKIRK